MVSLLIPPVKFWVRIALIVNKAMRSDPDVHLLVMTELKRLDWEVTDLTRPVRVGIYLGNKCFQTHVSCLFWTAHWAKMLLTTKRHHLLPSNTGWSDVVRRSRNKNSTFCIANRVRGMPNMQKNQTYCRCLPISTSSAHKHTPKTIHLFDSTRMWRNYSFMMQSA